MFLAGGHTHPNPPAGGEPGHTALGWFWKDKPTPCVSERGASLPCAKGEFKV